MSLAANATTVNINRESMLDGQERIFGGGTAKYDSATNTLTLNNISLDYNDEHPDGGSYGQAAIYIAGDLNIELVGENKITSNSYGIYQKDGTLKITGDSKSLLEVTTDGNDAIRVENIIISGCKLNASAFAGEGDSAIYATDKVTIEENADVTVKSDSAEGYALMAEMGMKIIDSKVYATITGERSNCIFSIERIIINNSIVETNAESINGYCAIQGIGGIEISGSEVTAKSAGYVAIYADANSLSINDSIIKATTANKDTIACGEEVSATIENSWIENYGGAVRESITLDKIVNFQENEGEVIGEVELPKDVVILENMTLTIPKNTILTIPENVTLTNEGTIENYGTIINNGTLLNKGIIRNNGDIEGNKVTGDGKISKPSSGYVPQKTLTFDTNGGSSISAVTENYGKTIVLADYTPKRTGYEFAGWYKDKELSEKIEYAVLDYDMTVYAKWQKTEETVEETGDYNAMIVLTIGDKTAIVNGKAVENDVAPLIVNSRTYTPARFVAEALGAKVEWSPSARTVTIFKDDINIVLAIDSNIAYVNGEAVKMDASAFIADGRTFTPARFVAEQLGANVEWDEEARTVTIWQ